MNEVIIKFYDSSFVQYQPKEVKIVKFDIEKKNKKEVIKLIINKLLDYYD